MQVFTPKRQVLLASIICYIAAWFGIGLAAMWLWLGWSSMGHDVVRNAIFNPVLIIDGLIVLVASILIALKNKAAVVFVSCYAIFMEAYLQLYQWHYLGYVKVKPYFIYEIIALILANVGVFWYHAAALKLPKSKKKH